MKFTYGSLRETKILELIHKDLFGFVPIPSLRGSLYYVMFRDDLSRNTWFYYLKMKSKVFIKFKEFKDVVENQTGKKIRF